MVCIIPKLVPRDISWRKCFLGGASATGFPGADLKACRSQVCSRDTGVRAISRFLFSIRLLSNAATACAASLGALSVVMAPKSPSMPLPPRAFLLCHGSLFPQQGNSPAGCWLHPLIHARQSRVGLFSVPFSTKYIPSQTGFLGNQASKTEIDWVENRILQKFHFAMFNNEGTQLTEAVVNVCN